MVGLALSGGGLRGITQIAVLKELEKADIPVDYIAGTSIGSVVGGLWAAGYSATEIWQELLKVDLSRLLVDSPQRSALLMGKKNLGSRAFLQFRMDGLSPTLPESFTPGQSLTEQLMDLLLNAPIHARDFDDFGVPLRIIATDLLTGKKVVLKEGDLGMAMRASIGIPLLLSPVEIDSTLLVDGGLLDNIPVEDVREMGADMVIAVNSTSPLRGRDDIKAPWELADQVTTIMQVPFRDKQLDNADVVIDFSDIEATSTESDPITLQNLYDVGERRAREKQNTILSTYWQKFQNPNTHDKPYWIDRIDVIPDIDVVPSQVRIPRASRYIHESEIERLLITFYQTGHFQSVSASLQHQNRDTVLVVNLETHPVLNHLRFYGNTIFSDSVLTSEFRDLIGKPINHNLTKAALKNIITRYRDKGYSLATIETTTYYPETHTAHIILSEGIIGDLTIKGLEKTKPYVIEREFRLKEGEIFRWPQAKAGIENIYATGLFRSVFLRSLPERDRWRIQLDLKERLSTLIRLGARYDLERQGRAFIEYSDTNIWGTGNDLTWHLQYGNKDRAVSVNFRSDRIFRSYLTAEVDVHYKKSRHFAFDNLHRTGEYDRETSGMIFRMGQQLRRFGTLSGFVRAERINILGVEGDGYDPGSLNINTVGFTSVIDTRDMLPYPRAGKYHYFFYEVSSGTVLGADISYFKVKNQLSTFQSFGKRHTFVPRLIWGFSDDTTPFSEQFRVGGTETFYGLEFEELVGRNVFLTRLDYRYLTPWNLIFDSYLGFTLDFGAVWETIVDIRKEDFLSGKGIYLSFKSPVGPLTLAYGWAGNGETQWYLSLGNRF
jgi:NTE family protein